VGPQLAAHHFSDRCRWLEFFDPRESSGLVNRHSVRGAPVFALRRAHRIGFGFGSHSLRVPE
jgi:hypothetical protein